MYTVYNILYYVIDYVSQYLLIFQEKGQSLFGGQ